MTAGSAEANGPMGSQEAVERLALAAAAPSRRRGRRRRRAAPTEPAIKGQLRMRSPSGVFVMVGISVVLVGMTIAVVGYWPQRAGASSGNGGSAGDARKEGAHARHSPHSEKLKLIGPVIMGIGLFIFICANTMLYENRDTETRLLMQKGLYGLAAGPGAEDGQGGLGPNVPVTTEGGQEATVSSPPSPVGRWLEPLPPVALLLHGDTSPSGSPRSGRAGASPQGYPDLSFGAGALLSSALALPIIKLNNRPLAGATALGSPIETPVPPRGPSRALLPAPRAPEQQDGHVVISMEGAVPAEPGTGRELCAELPLHSPGHSKSLDLGRPGVLLVAPIKDRRNRSCPRLDRLSLAACAGPGEPGEPPRGQRGQPGPRRAGAERGSQL